MYSLLRTRFIIWRSKTGFPWNVPPDKRKTRSMDKTKYPIPSRWAGPIGTLEKKEKNKREQRSRTW